MAFRERKLSVPLPDRKNVLKKAFKSTLKLQNEYDGSNFSPPIRFSPGDRVMVKIIRRVLLLLDGCLGRS